MNTCEMVVLADKNGKTYVNDCIKYNKVKGFHNDEGAVCIIQYEDNSHFLNTFCHDSGWEEFRVRTITIDKANKILEGIYKCPIKIVEGEK